MDEWYRKRSVVISMGALILLLAIVITYPSIKSYIKVPAATATKTDKQPTLPVAAPAESENLAGKKNLPVDIMVPEGAGHIVEGYKAKDGGKKESGGKVIIHVQDIHTNYEAQKNLSRIIETLINDKKLNLVMVEGGWGDVSLTYLRSYADKGRRLEVAEEYLKGGKISGEEYLNIVSDYDMDIEGLEDENLYKANLDAFFEIEKFRAKAIAELVNIKAAVEKLKEKLYPAQLQELEKTERDYKDEKISLADYYKHTQGIAEKTKIDLSAFPNFSSFMKVTESEKQINFPSVEKERSNIIEKLSKKFSKEKLTALVTKSLEFRLNKLTPAEYHNYLIIEAQEAGEGLDNYPNLKRYVSYISSHENIDTVRLFEEAETLSLKIKDKLATDFRQKRLNEISTGLDVLDNFLNLKLVPNDFNYYKQHKNDFITTNWVDFINKEIDRNKLKAPPVLPAATVDKNLSTLVKFYDIANERDDVFVKNAIKLMNEKNQNLAVIITGGFHTPPLTQKLRECGISYVVVAPHTTTQTDPELYRYILKYKSGREE